MTAPAKARRLAAELAAAVVVGSGAAAAATRARRRRGDRVVVILAYHDVAPDRDGPSTVSAGRLARHLRLLARRFRIVSLDEAAARLRGSRPLDEDCAVVTFDDGYAGNFSAAWPVLRAHGLPAAVFVSTGFLDGDELWFDRARRVLAAARGVAVPPALQARLASALGRWPASSVDAAVAAMKRLAPARRDALLHALATTSPPVGTPARPLTWEQATEMHAAGIEIGCHTVSHPVLPLLSPGAQEDEIVRARDRIAAMVGRAPAHFAYPNGDAAPDTAAIVRRAGFVSACGMVRGPNRPGADPFALARIGVGADSPRLLAARLAGVFDARVRDALARVGRAVGAMSPRTASPVAER